MNPSLRRARSPVLPVSFVLGALGALGALGLLLAGCGSAPTAEDVGAGEDELRTTYGDLQTTLDAHDAERWRTVRASLVAGFDRICGDTICSGDFGNLTTVNLSCASTTAARKMKDCVWVLGGNIAYVDGRSGTLASDARAFECHVPVAKNATTMLAALEAAGADALHAPLPGTGASFYDALVGCFARVQAAPPKTPSGTAFAEVADVIVERGGGAATAWFEARRQLAQQFDDACGDSFCEGEYPDIAPLRFACALDRAADRVAHCSWTFVSADVSVGPRGLLSARTATTTCDVAVDAPLGALTTVLAGSDALSAALPGRSSSIYDALVGCL